MSLETKAEDVGDSGEGETNPKETVTSESAAVEANQIENPGDLDESAGSSYNDYASTLEGPNVEEPETNVEAIIEFYKPIKIPALVYICMSMMICYEDGHAMTERFRTGNSSNYSQAAARVILVVFAFWIFGCVHSVIQLCKYVAMILNKYYKKDLYEFPTSRRPLAVGAMLLTKLASMLWTSLSAYYICDENNYDYPNCKSSFPHQFSTNLIEKFECKQGQLCSDLLMQTPMIFLAWCAFFIGKILIPEAMKGFREGEENRFKKLPYGYPRSKSPPPIEEVKNQNSVAQ